MSRFIIEFAVLLMTCEVSHATWSGTSFRKIVKWQYMIKYTPFRGLYDDWFKEPLSPLEITWRFPTLFKEAKRFLKKKLLFFIPDDIISFKNNDLQIRKDWRKLIFQLGAPIALLRIVKNLASEKTNWERGFFQISKTVESWENTKLEEKSDLELWKFANKVAEEDARISVYTVYVGLYPLVLEVALARFYKRFVKGNPREYEELLVGFTNKTIEMNMALFEMGKLKEQGKTKLFEKKYKHFLKRFGLRISDWDLVGSTFREDQAAINYLIDTYAKHTELDPQLTLERGKEKREKRFELAKENLKLKIITKPIFLWLIKWAWEYSPVRESRHHYALLGTYYIRKSLNIIGKRHKLKQNEIFYLEKDEVEKLVKGQLETKKANNMISRRYKIREQPKNKDV